MTVFNLTNIIGFYIHVPSIQSVVYGHMVKCCFTLSTNNSALNTGRTKQVIPQVYVYLPTLIPCLSLT